ncbi:MAG: PKD domain-containing protein [Dehalococcoidales bacterium]|nr:MAG: PKD domain-containing protein [Dehalococcoidales bacterium]
MRPYRRRLMHTINWLVLILLAIMSLSCTPPNDPPIIESLTADPEEVTQAGSSIIECIAHDPDEDNLTYEWTMTGGNIEGEGSRVTWIAPQDCAVYTISVTVTDERDGKASKDLQIKVKKPG